jgi:hypothetical protein
MPGMQPVIAGEVWHYWIAVPLFFGSLFALIALVVGYFKKVSALKYPRR